MNQLDMIRVVSEVHEFHLEAEEGDKHLASTGYAMEAIRAILSGYVSPIAQMFLDASR